MCTLNPFKQTLVQHSQSSIYSLHAKRFQLLTCEVCAVCFQMNSAMAVILMAPCKAVEFAVCENVPSFVINQSGVLFCGVLYYNIQAVFSFQSVNEILLNQYVHSNERLSEPGALKEFLRVCAANPGPAVNKNCSFRYPV